MTRTGILENALKKGAERTRLDRDEACAIAHMSTPDKIHRLGEAALQNRRKRFGDRATYVVNQHINPSNICEGECRFCRYSAKSGDKHAYVLTEEAILEKIGTLRPTEVHIVGGMNRIWDYHSSLRLIGRIREQFRDIHIKGYTAVEIDWFARCEGKGITNILSELKEAGLNGMPGGGAELFSKRMRREYCPNKIGPRDWIHIHHIAHRCGIITNATMLYGLNETPEERVDHLLALRDAQDETKGFSCFIPLAYQPGADEGDSKGPYPQENLAMIGLARLVLDNFDHIKAYWPMIGLETASIGLSFGADDIDGTIGGEQIAHAAGAQTPGEMTKVKMEETIRLGGFAPVERNGRFEELETTI